MSEGAHHRKSFASLSLRLSDQRRPTLSVAAGPERADEGGGPDAWAFFLEMSARFLGRGLWAREKLDRFAVVEDQEARLGGGAAREGGLQGLDRLALAVVGLGEGAEVDGHGGGSA